MRSKFVTIVNIMAEASIFLSKPKLRDINKYRELDDEWYSLGIELEIDDNELEILEEKYSADPHKRLIKMFGVWLEKGESPTYRKLVEALVEIDKKDIAQAICMKLGKYSSYQLIEMPIIPSSDLLFAVIRCNYRGNLYRNYRKIQGLEIALLRPENSLKYRLTYTHISSEYFKSHITQLLPL